MKPILFAFLAITCSAIAEVPSLINYQGRLTNAEGEPLTGTKNFELKIYDSQEGGKLLYTEDVGAIQLGEGGVYSFQFGGKGTSNTQITETVGNGDGSVLYQKILSNTPVVEGSVSVSDGTYTWSQESGSSNEDDFSASFSKNLSRITVNYFADAPNDGRQIDVTYRYEAEGIVGALSSGSEHWLQLSVDGEVQATRERVLAVPFALYAGKLAGANNIATKAYYSGWRQDTTRLSHYPLASDEFGTAHNKPAILRIPERAKKLISIRAKLGESQNRTMTHEFRLWGKQAGYDLDYYDDYEVQFKDEDASYREVTIPLNWKLNAGEYNEIHWNPPSQLGSNFLMPPLYLEYEY